MWWWRSTSPEDCWLLLPSLARLWTLIPASTRGQQTVGHAPLGWAVTSTDGFRLHPRGGCQGPGGTVGEANWSLFPVTLGLCWQDHPPGLHNPHPTEAHRRAQSSHNSLGHVIQTPALLQSVLGNGGQSFQYLFPVRTGALPPLCSNFWPWFCPQLGSGHPLCPLRCCAPTGSSVIQSACALVSGSLVCLRITGPA